MPAPPLTTISLGAGVPVALDLLPRQAGVGQILGPDGTNLVIGRAAQLRRWAAAHLGFGRARKGARPPTDLRPVAAAVAYATSTSAFHQRLVYERLMAGHVPLRARRDLRPPAFLRLDPAERFPRVTIETRPGGPDRRFGPFRDRRAADRAVRALHKVVPLRPCEFVFEPDPRLSLGLGCVYAQLRTCAAPCLARLSEDAYRELARQAAAFLEDPDSRPAEAATWMPAWVGAAGGSGLVVEERAEGVAELYPVRGGAVLEDGALAAPLEALPDAAARLRWPSAEAATDDWPWLSAWLHARRQSGFYLVVRDPDDRAALGARLRRLRDGDRSQAMVT